MIDAENNVLFSDYVVLSNQMSQGEMENIKIIMKDESRNCGSPCSHNVE